MSTPFIAVPRGTALAGDPGVARTLPPALSALARHLDDPNTTDLFVNGGAGIFIDRGAGVERIAAAEGEERVRALAIALIAAGGRHIDDATPCVDVRLEGGVRVHAVLPPIAPDGTLISIRLPQPGPASLDALEAVDLFTPAQRVQLEGWVRDRANLLVTGAAGAGKTTLLAALLSAADPAERIVTVEDVAELQLRHPHHVRLEARQANLEGVGAMGLDRLVREALRMRPDRLVVGECRGTEIRELLTALNTGHDGGAGTVHANSLRDVPARLEALGALVGWDDAALARQVSSAFDVVLHLARTPQGRRLAGIGRPIVRAGRLAVEEES